MDLCLEWLDMLTLRAVGYGSLERLPQPRMAALYLVCTGEMVYRMYRGHGGHFHGKTMESCRGRNGE